MKNVFQIQGKPLNHTNSIQVDLKYILSSHDYFGFIRKI